MSRTELQEQITELEARIQTAYEAGDKVVTQHAQGQLTDPEAAIRLALWQDEIDRAYAELDALHEIEMAGAVT